MPKRAELATSVKKLLGRMVRQGLLEKVRPDGQQKGPSVLRLAEAPSIAPEQIAVVRFAKLELQIPRTYDGLWALMNWLDRERGGFTEHEVVQMMCHDVDAAVVVSYVRALERCGAILPALTIQSATRYFRVDRRRQVETPRVARDGSLLIGPQRLANLWRSMKMCGYFTARDLAVAASMPDLPISEDSAGRYAADLAHAGYLITKTRPGEATVYRLRSTHNTGPAAPEVLRARFVWDPNLCRIVGDAASIDEVRP